MSGYNSKKKPGVKKDIKQPTIPLPSQPGYHGQDLASLLDSRQGKIDMNWLEQVGSNQPGGINNGMGGFSTKPNNDPVKSNNGQNPMNSTYADMLLNNSQGGFADFLASLGIQQQTGLTGSQRDAWNNYLLQTLIQYYLTQENRQYDRALQLDQRLYDTPTNQLARIMGAGISRDAAIQLLSGGSGSGSGAGVPYSQPAGAGDMAAANQAGQMPFQNAATVFGAIAQTAGAIGSLGSFGLSAASLSTNLAATRAATAGQLLSNTQLQKTLNGIETASTVVGAISSAYQAGIIDKNHNFGSSQEMLKFIRDNADKYEPFNSLVSSGALDGIAKDVYSLDALNHAYTSWRKTRDYNIDRKHLVRMQSLQRMQAGLDYERTCSEINLNKQNIAESINRVINDNIRVGNETNIANANIDYLGAQAFGVRQENRIKKLDADWYEANIEDINTARLGQVMLEAAEWSEVMDDPAKLRTMVETWLIDKENQRTAVALECLYLSDEYDTQTDLHNPNSSSYNARQTALWFHNVFNFALGEPKTTDTDAIDKLGALGKTALGAFLLKRPM